MIQQSQSADRYLPVLQGIDRVLLFPNINAGDEEMAIAALENIALLFRDFMERKSYTLEGITLTDGFLFLFNDPEFSQWHAYNWWEQRQRIRSIKDHESYMARAHSLLQHSRLSRYVDYSDEMVARSNELEVKRAWMQKRLVMKEAFWNAIDSISHAAYFQQKYRDQFPALCMLLLEVQHGKDRKTELVLGIDNGTGRLYKKKSRDSSLIRFLYKLYKLFFKKGVFYIGGLELGLQETEGELSFHGSGAVVYQGW